MKINSVRTFLCLALVWVGPLATTPQVAFCAQRQSLHSDVAVLPCGYGEVSGVVTAADTGLPLPNVTVISYGYSYRTTSTNAKGEYAFQYAVASGPNKTTLFSLSLANTGRYYSFDGTPLSSVISGTVTTKNFSMTVGASVVGRVSATDVLTPNVSVEISATGSQRSQHHAFTSTDANGRYEFLGVPTGSYKLKFSGDRYPDTYFGGAGTPDSGTIISITAPNTVTANIILSPGATLVGNVIAADTGSRLGDVNVVAYSVDEPGVVSRSAKRYLTPVPFEIQGLRPGRYRLSVIPTFGPMGVADTEDYIGQYYNNQISSTLGDLITITQLNQTVGVTVALQRGGVITGLVSDADTGLPIPGMAITLDFDRVAANYSLLGDHPSGGGAVTDASGVYTITGLVSGRYEVRTPYDPYGYSKFYYSQIYPNHDVITSAVAGDRVTVTAPLTVTNINFALHKIFTGTVLGRVTNPSGQGIRSVTVKLSPTDALANSNYGTDYAYSDANGYYTATLPTRGYFVNFSRDTTGFCDGCYNNQFYTQQDQTTAQAVHVAVGSVVNNINATFICGKAAPAQNKTYLPLLRK